jgi:uncharacterized protein YidB (DUF937 family)
MKALLGVLAVAGYQNRDKIAEILKGIQNPQAAGGTGRAGGLGGILDSFSGGGSGALGGLGSLLGGSASGNILSGGLGDLLKTFQQNGHGDKAESWVRPGPNADIDGNQLEQAIGADVLQDLAAKTGLSREDILDRLSRDLPKTVDELTPDGRIPEAQGGTTF